MYSFEKTAPSEKMLSFAPTSIFSGQWDHRPSVPSPLSSSPARASSPLSPIDKNVLPQRQTQSSPIAPPKFKFGTRPVRPNPMVRRREDVQESRRKNFFQNVRQKAEDKAWQRRDIEGQYLKRSLMVDQQHLVHDAPDFTDADIEDAMAFQEQSFDQPSSSNEMVQQDDVMEDPEFEAMVASFEKQHNDPLARPPSPNLSDEEYDDIFAELAAQEQAGKRQHLNGMSIMDMSGGDVDMS